MGHQFGRDSEDHVTVTEFVGDGEIVFESEGGAGRLRHYFRLQEEDGGTHLTKGVELLKPSFLLRLFSPIAAAFRVTVRGFDGDLKRIKARLEGSTIRHRRPRWVVVLPGDAGWWRVGLQKGCKTIGSGPYRPLIRLPQLIHLALQGLNLLTGFRSRSPLRPLYAFAGA